MSLDFLKVDQAHDDMSETLEYADSSKLDIRERASGLCLALNELQEQRQKASENKSPDNPAWEQHLKDLLECESIISSIVDFVNIWNRESSLPEIHSAGEITKAIDKLWSRASYRDVIMQATLSSIAANSCCKPCQEAGRVATDGLRAASYGELLWIERKPCVDLSKFDAQGNRKPSAETPHQ